MSRRLTVWGGGTEPPVSQDPCKVHEKFPKLEQGCLLPSVQAALQRKHGQLGFCYCSLIKQTPCYSGGVAVEKKKKEREANKSCCLARVQIGSRT